MTIALIDLDSFVYACGFAGQTNKRSVRLLATGELIGELAKGERVNAWCKESGYTKDEIEIETEVIPEPLANVLHSAKLMVRSIIAETKADEWELYLTGKGNFREDIYPEYKANRKEMVKPVHYQAIRDYYHLQMDAHIIDGMEADDMVAIRATELDGDGIICSIDKDLKTVPGLYFNPNKPDDGVIEIDPWTASFNFYVQLLMGDKADNIPGINGIGLTKAENILVNCEDEREMYEVCMEQYLLDEEKQSGTWLDINVNAQLLHMKRTRDDVWQPPS